MDGTLAGQDFTARYLRGGELVAAASVGRDVENLALEAELREAAVRAAVRAAGERAWRRGIDG